MSIGCPSIVAIWSLDILRIYSSVNESSRQNKKRTVDQTCHSEEFALKFNQDRMKQINNQSIAEPWTEGSYLKFDWHENITILLLQVCVGCCCFQRRLLEILKCFLNSRIEKMLRQVIITHACFICVGLAGTSLEARRMKGCQPFRCPFLLLWALELGCCFAHRI